MGVMAPKHPLNHHAAIGKRTNHTVDDDKQNGEKTVSTSHVCLHSSVGVLVECMHAVSILRRCRAAAGDRKSVALHAVTVTRHNLATSAPVHAVLSAVLSAGEVR